MSSAKTIIACPECKHEFHPEEALEHALREQLSSEFREKEDRLLERVKKEADDKTSEQIRALKSEYDQAESARVAELRQANEKLKQAEDAKNQLENKARELHAKQSAIEEQERNLNTIVAQKSKEYEAQVNERMLAEFKRREQLLDDSRRKMETQYLQMLNAEVEKVNNASKLQVRELEKQLSDQKALVEEMNRKQTQGSMQLQGEVGELFIEEELRAQFPLDEIQPVPKGLNGADSIQVIFNQNRVCCGRIIYESKRTKHFSHEWIDKLKADMRSANCDMAVLVTEALPKDHNRFTLLDGVWVCTFVEFKSIALILRQGLIRAGEVIMAQENKGTKMQMLYDYLTGPQFRGQVEGIVEAYTSMKTSLDKEKKVFNKIWAERDKSLERILHSASNMYGNIQGISGAAMSEIKSLEFDSGLVIEKE